MAGDTEWEPEDTGEWVEPVMGSMESLPAQDDSEPYCDVLLYDHRGKPFPRRPPATPLPTKIPIGFALPPRPSSS